MAPFDDLKDARVLVTGGATGIGGAVSRAFADAGARVYVHYHGGAEAAEALVTAIRADGGTVEAGSGDLTKRGAAAAVVDAAASALGGLDVLVNNAGSMVARRPFEECDDDLLDRVFDLNCRQVVEASRAALPHLRAAGGGSIVTTTSIAARNGGSPGSAFYASAKGFVSTLTRSLARELAGDNIRVNAVSPGTIHTNFHEVFSTPEKLEATARAIPMGRLGLAEDCAGTYLYLASPSLSGYVTGQVVEVNGGQLIA
ncbi:MAG: SDR family oxidoreductase [Azospirillaceae bacterium]